MSSRTGTEPTTGGFKPGGVPMTDGLRGASSYLTLDHDVPAPRRARLRPPLDIRAEALMSSPVAMTVDPHSHAGQQYISDETICHDAVAALQASGPVDGQRPEGSRPRTVTRHGWTMRDVAAGRVRCARRHDAITRVAAIMRDNATDAVPVINDRGNVIGVITATDILDLLARYDSDGQR